MANVQYPAGQGALAQAALPAAQGIQPADELAAHGAQAAGGQVAQVVQQVVGQEALPAAEHVAQEILPAAAQVPQQAVGQAQHGELEVEYVLFLSFRFSSFCLFLYIYKLRTGTRAATLYLSSIFRWLLFSLYRQFYCIFGARRFFAMGDYMLLTWVASIRGMFISGSVFCYLGLCNNRWGGALRWYLSDVSIECQKGIIYKWCQTSPRME